VFLPPVNTKTRKKADILSYIKETEYKASIHIPTNVDLKHSVFYYVIIIQCLARCRRAWKAKKLLIRCNEAFAKFQRHFRLRSMKYHFSAFKIQAFFHFILAKKKASAKKRDIYAAKTLQRGFRCYAAKMKLLNKRCVPPYDISILKVTPTEEVINNNNNININVHLYYHNSIIF